MAEKIILLGASLESDNRGVNALGIGAITIIKNSYPDSEISLLLVGSKRYTRKKIFIEGKELPVDLYYFPKYDYLKSIFESILNKVFRIPPKMDISKLITKSNL